MYKEYAKLYHGATAKQISYLGGGLGKGIASTESKNNKALTLSNAKKIKTPSLKAAYLSQFSKISKEILSNKLKLVIHEKARYYANRIAQNEVMRAYMDKKAYEIANDSNVGAVAIVMSKTHPRADICDYFASVDKYGLGAGVYPKDKAPVPPFHPFFASQSAGCRCAMVPKFAIKGDKAKLDKKADEEYLNSLNDAQKAMILGSKNKAYEAEQKGDITAIYNAMKPERYKVKEIKEIIKESAENSKKSAKNTKKEKQEPKTIQLKNQEAHQELLDVLKHNKIYYNEVKKLKEPLSEEQIITKVGGGDLTKGSCRSVALAYAANKNGYDVRDFRGGSSCWVFAKDRFFDKLLEYKGVKSFSLTSTNEIKSTVAIVKNIEKGKEYILSVGKHAAIVKSIDEKVYYLELQDKENNKNKWYNLTIGELKNRFGAKQQNKSFGRVLTTTTTLVEIDSLFNNAQTLEILCYINTDEKYQQKGIEGGKK